jgi:NAD-dependent SIR2 family protein deacetylase
MCCGVVDATTFQGVCFNYLILERLLHDGGVALILVLQSEHTTSLFCQMIAQLSNLSQAAMPTPFHKILRALDDRGKLLRVYTQNIDAIESKSGLSFGVPDFDGRRKPRLRGKAAVPIEELVTPLETTSSRLPTPPDETPRCIPLHGTLQTLHCQTCTHTFPLEDHLPSLTSGTPPYCPECTAMEATRQLVGKRARGVGKLRPSVVLYNETHKDGEGVGEAVRKDLVGGSKGKGRSGADLLLVVGTSLRVPGTKRIVREFAKAVRSRDGPASGLATPSPSPRRTPSSDEEPMLKSVYLNLDFPVPTREWEGVFDAWVQGNAQDFAEILGQEIEEETRSKHAAVERKRKREDAAMEREEAAGSSVGKKRKATPETSAKGSKKRKLPPTPQSKRKVKVNPKVKPLSARKDKQASNAKSPSRTRRKVLVPEVYISTPAHRIPKPEPLDRQEDLAKAPGGRWKRGPLILPGHAEVPPVVDKVDEYRSFKMFDAGWILPESQKRGGRKAVERKPFPLKRGVNSAKIMSTPTATMLLNNENLNLETEDAVVIVDDDTEDDILSDFEEFTEHSGHLPVSFLRTDQ